MGRLIPAGTGYKFYRDVEIRRSRGTRPRRRPAGGRGRPGAEKPLRARKFLDKSGGFC